MSIIKKINEELTEIFNNIGYEVEQVNLQPSGRKDLGDYQINDAMTLAKKYHQNPREIAEKIKKELEKSNKFTNINIAGPGFINITFQDEFIYEFLNEINKDINNNIDKVAKKKVIIDYGGANIAKALHVGHLRSANIGEAVKRLAKTLGYETIGDVHFGDIGRQSGMVISEIKRRNPNLAYFDDNYNGDYNDIDFDITEDELAEIYPTASIKAKEDESIMEEVVEITKELETGHKGYTALWNKIKEVSIKDIMGVYEKINTHFELLEGESDCYPYIKETVDILEKSNKLIDSEGAKIIDVKEETDTSPMPPLVVIKSNGATLYATRELATLYSRIKRFAPDEIWYFTDMRQQLYFEQVFRAAKKTNLVNENVKLEWFGFGTMNGPDGKPFKTRDGGVMSLKELIKNIETETSKKINKDIVIEEKAQETAEQIAIAALKYADLIPFRTTDYIFDTNKFIDFEGKTGPYLLYSTIRMKSLLNKAKDIKVEKITKLKGESEKEIALTLLNLPIILKKSLEVKSVNDIADFIYTLTSKYNKFYAENKVLLEKDKLLQESWIILTSIVYNTNKLLLDILGLQVPEKM